MAVVPRAVMLTVAEVKDMVASLKAARAVRNLTGRQRQQLQEAHDELLTALNMPRKGMIQLPVTTVVQILRSATMTQTWLSEMFHEASVVGTNES